MLMFSNLQKFLLARSHWKQNAFLHLARTFLNVIDTFWIDSLTQGGEKKGIVLSEDTNA